mmetsp:Transcript_33672/g.47857  ORF Transcript_33672/g.47857 Transcript_33672/m.47857 type:complete len:379 (+) Transcript_33672:306-1442(+)
MQTRLFTEQFEGKTVPMNECKHMLYDGLKNSQFLQLIDVVYTHKNAVVKGQPGHDAKDDLLWVIDAHHVEPSSCNILETMAKQTLQLKNNVPWHILAVDYGDNNELHHCSGLIDIIGTKHYRFAKRSIGRGREWVESNHFPSRGGFIQQQQIGSGPILHIPYSARSDLSTLFYQQVISRGFKTPLQIARTELDVAHFSARTPKPYFDNLRNSVNVALQFLSGQTFAERPHDPVKVFTGLAGSAMKRGRNQANQEYVTKMLQAKIVVVAQRDAWSGHYRLTEALLSGALIVADETVVLPRGFRDGESIVIFTSFGDLREKLLYFLDPANEEERFAVAQRGWEINQGYHRSWHVMEATVYGRPQTYVGDPIANFNSHTTT